MNGKIFLVSLLTSFILGLGFLYLSSNSAILHAQETETTPSPTPLAHLTFRTCLVPETNVFRLSFRADYVAGEYRVVGDNTDYTLNLGYLDVGQTGGGFGEDNTTYILPVEDTWIKQWYNGTRWQRAGGLPVTNIQQHIDSDLICETGGQTPYSPYPTSTPPITSLVDQTPSPTATPTPTEIPGRGGVDITIPTPSPIVQNNTPVTNTQTVLASTNENRRVLGISTMGETGNFFESLLIGQFVVGVLSVAEGARRLNKNQ